MKNLFFALLAVLLATPAAANPVSVLLHPNGALVLNKTELTPEADRKTIRLDLPSAADIQSLDISVEYHELVTLRFEDVTAATPTAVAALREELNTINRTIMELEGAQNDLEVRRAYWRNPPVKLSETAPLTELDALMQRRLEAFRLEGFERALQLKSLNEQAALLQLRLELAGGDNPFSKQAVLVLAEPATGPVEVRFSYNLPSAGWRPMYRLEARPESGQVLLTLEAEIWQRSGEDWTEVPLVLSTSAPHQGMTPPRLNAWVLLPQAPVVRAQPRPALQQAEISESHVGEASPRPPLYMDGTSFASWDLGKRSVPAGSSQRMTLNRETMKAEFAYLLRPSLSDAAYLTARIEMPELRYFPAGDAMFIVDGTPVGQAHFSLPNDETRIYFGRDPLVSATMKQGGQQAGKQGIIDRKQNYSWDWNITVFNRHNRPVDVRVEEPAPQSRDAQIVLSVTSKPEAVSEDHTLIWNLKVPAQKSENIQHAVTFTAPPDMRVWKGR